MLESNQNFNEFVDSIFFNARIADETDAPLSFCDLIEPYKIVDGINIRSGEPIEAYNENVANWYDKDGTLIQGVYLNMPEVEYHRIPAYSSTGIKTFADNPHKAENIANGDQTFSISPQLKKSFDTGHYLHSLLLEPNRTNSDVVILPTAEELKKAGKFVLENNEQLKAYLEAHNLENGATISERIKIAQQYRNNVIYYPFFVKELNDKSNRILTQNEADKIKLAVKDINQSETSSKLFSGGYSELTIIAFDHDRGVWVKARLDKVTKNKMLIDLKTIHNLTMPQIYRDLEDKLYSIQGAFYHHVARLAEFELVPDVFGLFFVEWDEYQRSVLVEISEEGWQLSIKYMHEIFDDFVAWMNCSVKKSSITKEASINVNPRLYNLKKRVRTAY